MKIMLPTNPVLTIDDAGTESSEIDQAVITHADDIITLNLLTDGDNKLDRLDWLNVTIFRVSMAHTTSPIYYTNFPTAVRNFPVSDVEMEPETSYQWFLSHWDEAATCLTSDSIEDFADKYSGSLGCWQSDEKRILLLTAATVAPSINPIGMLLDLTDMPVAEFSRTYDLPDSTVRAWANGKASPAHWTVQLLTFAVGMDIAHKGIE